MKIKLSDFLSQYLVKKGITDTFMVTGGGAMHLNDSLGHTKGMRITFNHHEQACAIAAEGYTRLNGKLCLVNVTTGPGGTNAITGVYGAWTDSVPMLVVSGQVKRETTLKHCKVKLRQLGDQEVDIISIVKSITKYSEFVDDPNMIKYYLDKAIYLATTGRQGPVWLDIPLDVQASIIDTSKLVEFNPKELKPEYPIYKGEHYKDITNLIKKAKRPIIYAGAGIIRSKSKDLLIKFATKYDIPIATCWNAIDLIPSNHRLYAGRPGTVGTRGGNFNVQNSDLVLVLGCRLNIRQISYNWKCFAKNAYKVMVDIDKNEMNKPTIDIDLKIHSDVKDFLSYFVNKDSLTIKHTDWVNYSHQINNKYKPILKEYYKKKRPLNPYAFMYELSKVIKDDDIIVTGNGSVSVIGQQVLQIKKNNRLFSNSGCAAMGYGFPASLGASIAAKGKRVICLDGDGSFQMNIQELQTVVFNKPNLKIIYLNNGGYSSIRQTQTNLFKSRFVGIGDGYGLTTPNMSKVIRAYGIPYFKIDSLGATNKLLIKSLNSKGPIFIEVLVDKNQFFAPKLSSKILPNGTIVSPELDDMYPFLPPEEYNKNKIKN